VWRIKGLVKFDFQPELSMNDFVVVSDVWLPQYASFSYRRLPYRYICSLPNVEFVSDSNEEMTRICSAALHDF
jgi:hypothetical protein